MLAPAADRRLLYAATFLRALAIGLVGVTLGLYLAKIGFGPAASGAVVGAGLAGATAASVAVTLGGDRGGRRRVLVALGGAAAAGGAALAGPTTPAALAAVAFLGMVNGMGRDRGAALILEQAMLPATVGDAERTRAFAVYNVLQDVGHALGGLAAAGLDLLPVDDVTALQIGLGAHAALLAATALVSSRLSPAVDVPAAEPTVCGSPDTRRALAVLCALFGLDALAGGFLTAALLSQFFADRFGVGAGALGLLFFAARVLNAGSHLVAARLARTIGLVNTMVFTHLPSSLLLATVPLAPTFPVAAALFLLREGLVEMDVPTRQSYVMAIVQPAERTLAAGVTQLVRTAGWAAGAWLAGSAMQGLTAGAPLVAAATMKVVYDVILWVAFRRRVPPEERDHGG